MIISKKGRVGWVFERFWVLYGPQIPPQPKIVQQHDIERSRPIKFESKVEIRRLINPHIQT